MGKSRNDREFRQFADDLSLTALSLLGIPVHGDMPWVRRLREDEWLRGWGPKQEAALDTLNPQEQARFKAYWRAQQKAHWEASVAAPVGTHSGHDWHLHDRALAFAENGGPMKVMPGGHASSGIVFG